jgi:hypothetical protein
VAKGADIDEIRIGRMDDDVGDLARVAEPHEGPGLSPVSSLPHAIAVGDIAADRIFAAAHEDHIGRRRCDGDGTNGAAEVFVADWCPGLAGVDGLEDAAAARAHPELVGAGRIAGAGNRSAAAVRTDLAPVKSGEGERVALRHEGRGERQGGEENSEA